MTSDLLAWLLLAPLLAIALVPRAERGGAASRFIVAAFAIATMLAGAGSLATSTLRTYAEQSAGNALFMSLSAGLVVGAVSPWRRAAWPSWVATLLVALVVTWPVSTALHWGGFLLGAVLGALPYHLGRAIPGGVPVAVTDSLHELPPTTALVLTVAAAVLAVAEPLALTLLAPAVPLAWWLARRGRTPLGARRLAGPAVALLAGLTLGWLALTIAGDPLVRLGSYFATAPVSPAAEQWLALLALVMVLAMLAPWPLHRFGVGLLLLPAAVLLTWRLAGRVAPDLLGAWQPLVGMALVPLAVIAAWRGRWAEALGMSAMVAALRPEPLAMLAATLAVLGALGVAVAGPGRNLVRPDRVTFSGEWWVAMLAAAGASACAIALLQHEVVLATLLAGGLASAASRRARAASVA